MEFTPRGNDSLGLVCDGIEEYESRRPDPSPAYLGVSWFFFLATCVLWGGSIILFWALRHVPRFNVVRPFTLSALLAVAHIVFAIGSSLNLAIRTVPCGLLIFSIVMGVAGFGVNIFCRLLVFVVESQFAMRTGKYKIAMGDDDSQSQGSGSSSNKIGALIGKTASRMSSLVAIAKLALGISTIEQVSMEQLAMVKKMYGMIAATVLIPALVPVLVYIAVSPEYHQCSGCAIYLDALFFCASGVLFYILCIRVLFVAWKLNFPDSQGIFKEVSLIALTCGGPSLLAAILLIIDPNGASFRREFAFEWIAQLTMLGFWWVSAGYQFLLAYRDSKRYYTKSTSSSNRKTSVETSSVNGKARQSLSSSLQQDFIAVIEENDELKKEFEEYTTKQYAVENLYFVLDVNAFKRFCHEKGASWRKQKARMLFETYVKTDAVMEVNVSQETKQDIVAKCNVILKDNHEVKADDVINLFDDAVTDITNAILWDIWTRFQKDRRFNDKFAVVATPRTTSLHSTSPGLVSRVLSSPPATLSALLPGSVRSFRFIAGSSPSDRVAAKESSSPPHRVSSAPAGMFSPSSSSSSFRSSTTFPQQPQHQPVVVENSLA